MPALLKNVHRKKFHTLLDDFINFPKIFKTELFKLKVVEYYKETEDNN